VNAGIVAEAAGLFAVTNLDDIVVLSLFFGRGTGQRGAGRQIVAGQYFGFAALLAVTVAAAYGASFLPESGIAYLGLLPLALGLSAAWQAWKGRRDGGRERGKEQDGPGSLQVAAVTYANGSDNISVYLPVFAKSGATGIPSTLRFSWSWSASGAPPGGSSLPARRREGHRPLGARPAPAGADRPGPVHPHPGRRVRPVTRTQAARAAGAAP
jgi:hypothetical protein